MIKNVAFKPDFPFTTLPDPAALRAVKGGKMQANSEGPKDVKRTGICISTDFSN